MKIVAISDLHGKECWLNIPTSDILIIAGDMGITSLYDAEYVNRWLGNQLATTRILVAGNHDTWNEKVGKDVCKEIFTNAIYLENELVEVDGLKIYGSPHTPEFNNWAFMYPRYSLDAKNIWAKIPENLDFLVTHGPAFGILDRNQNDERCGCSTLLREIDKKRPKRHVFGHIHLFGSQSITQEGINFYNVSVLNEDYKLVHKPTIIEI